MYIKELKFKNIGPFSEAELHFPFEKVDKKIPVTIITGENGTGKSIIIDAIRALFMSYFGIDRDIVADKSNFSVEMIINDGEDHKIQSIRYKDCKIDAGSTGFETLFKFTPDKSRIVNWVIDYWHSYLGTDSFQISSLSSIDINSALLDALNKNVSNVELTKFICSIDYLRSSDDKKERETGQYVYKLLKEIIGKCLLDGQLVSVRRRDLSPIVKVHNREVTLEKLSSGNLLLIERLIGLIRRMYGICELNKRPIKDITKIEGILLIDEIENHLHPKWQKSVMETLQTFFPNIQIIITTHSPFIVSSVKNATVFVCKSMIDYSIVEDETDDYSNLPVDEVLNTPVFNVGPFNDKITNLLRMRKEAIMAGKKDEAEKYAQELLAINENYFTFYKIDGRTEFYDNETY